VATGYGMEMKRPVRPRGRGGFGGGSGLVFGELFCQCLVPQAYLGRPPRFNPGARFPKILNLKLEGFNPNTRRTSCVGHHVTHLIVVGVDVSLLHPFVGFRDLFVLKLVDH